MLQSVICMACNFPGCQRSNQSDCGMSAQLFLSMRALLQGPTSQDRPIRLRLDCVRAVPSSLMGRSTCADAGRRINHQTIAVTAIECHFLFIVRGRLLTIL